MASISAEEATSFGARPLVSHTILRASFRISATDWAAGGPRLGEDTAVHADTRYTSAGARDGVGVSIWHVALPLDRTKTAVSLTLPDDTRLAMYAVSGRDA